MRKIIGSVAVMFAFCTATHAQSVLFDFDNAPYRTSLPISLTSGDFTAQFSATGQGFSIQSANVMGFTPVGFSGLCIYPSSVYLADLRVTFSKPVTDFSILYAPEEYACDSSATMRVTGYMDGVSVATNTQTAEPGTWPSATLTLSAWPGFNSVVVHYAASPATGGDWGPIFMTDNMLVTPIAPVRGDFSQDRLVNAADIAAMLTALSDLDAFKGNKVISDTDLVTIGDFTGDGFVMNDDIQPMLNYVASRPVGGAPAVVPEPASWVLLSIVFCAVAYRARNDQLTPHLLPTRMGRKLQ